MLLMMNSKTNESDEESDEEPSTNAITTYTEAIKHGNDMLTFFQDRGEGELANNVLTIVQIVEHAKLKHSQQTSLLDCTAGV